MSGYEHREYRPDGTFWVSERRDDTLRTVTTFDEAGEVTSSRPYTAAESATVDEAAAGRQQAANAATIGSRLVTVDLPAMQAIINQPNADLRADPAQELKDIARAVRRLTRKVEGILDGTD
jgi:hypothetical protein